MTRLKITLNPEAERLLTNIKKRMHPKVRWNFLSEFVSNELIKHYYHKTKAELELEVVRIEAAQLNETKRDINARLAYLSEKAKGLREKIKEQKDGTN